MELEKQVGRNWFMEPLELAEEEEPQIICIRNIIYTDLCFRKISLVAV